MSIFSHSIFENVRTRVIVIHDGAMLLLPPGTNSEAAWSPPGGGMERDESLAECAAREVLEETGIAVDIGRVAFLREWVAPRYCTNPEDPGGAGEFGFGMEVFFYATRAASGDVPRAQCEWDAHWVKLEDVPGLALWPNELKSLALAIAAQTTPPGVHSFVTDFIDPTTPPGDVIW